MLKLYHWAITILKILLNIKFLNNRRKIRNYKIILMKASLWMQINKRVSNIQDTYFYFFYVNLLIEQIIIFSEVHKMFLWDQNFGFRVISSSIQPLRFIWIMHADSYSLYFLLFLVVHYLNMWRIYHDSEIQSDWESDQSTFEGWNHLHLD